MNGITTRPQPTRQPVFRAATNPVRPVVGLRPPAGVRRQKKNQANEEDGKSFAHAAQSASQPAFHN